MPDGIRTWHAPDALPHEARVLLAKESPRTPGAARPSAPAPMPVAAPTARTPGQAPISPSAPKPARPNPHVDADVMGWLTAHVGRRLEIAFLDGLEVRGVLVRVSRYELLLREDRPGGAPAELLVMKGALARAREAT